jgi:9-cis-epoxycarotenoid dioxygenase
VSAHPKVDKRSGHFCAFGYDKGKPFVHYSYFNSDRQLLNYVKIPIGTPRMLHDFAITENYIIVPDLPMENNPKHCIDGRWMYQLNVNKPARYGIMNRECKDPNQM